MKNDELKRIVLAIVFVGSGCWLAMIWFFQVALISVEAIRSLPFAATLTGLIAWFYCYIGWRLPLLRFLAPRPNLRGTWYGKLQSDYREQGKGIAPMSFALAIRQSFLWTRVHSLSENLEAQSYTASLMIDREAGSRSLLYIYMEREPNRPGSRTHRGTAEVRIIGDPPVELRGEYWTARKTRGTFKLTKLSKECVETIEEVKRLVKLNNP